MAFSCSRELMLRDGMSECRESGRQNAASHTRVDDREVARIVCHVRRARRRVNSTYVKLHFLCMQTRRKNLGRVAKPPISFRAGRALHSSERAMRVRSSLFLLLGHSVVRCSGGHPGTSTTAALSKSDADPNPDKLVRHEATFTTFCDTGSVAGGDCLCKGGSATAAIGDGSWLWHELVGEPCPAQPDDRCDCTSCGGQADDCPHEGCWQCQGVNAPWCNPSDELKRCEVSVHGTRGAEKYYITEVCPSAHPCNRCKEMRLQRCAARAPLAIDICGTTWSHVFETSRSEADGFVTLSCYPTAYGGETEATAAVSAKQQGTCYSTQVGDVSEETCEDWCSVASAQDHCQWCKCRGCEAMRDACKSVVAEIEEEATKTASFLSKCSRSLDCKSWCNIGNCRQCPCAACERCGLTGSQSAAHSPVAAAPPPPSPIVRNIVPATSWQQSSVACHGWCVEGAKDDKDTICKSSKCQACSMCAG